ncbi:PaaI family thioesterase [Gordonia sp. (in: high G+C Gram-positive bacteria)]|uniref:PaaI family thioesterase n=1 Tax=Gordonia sp. (in: high G+C Gram-positive bacteria) TaxID=84139 RepID=UPI0025B9C32A|nr:PaaI family thioesterase [Gordonia sp. (in: high G+C Gram-positive bacteria)]
MTMPPGASTTTDPFAAFAIDREPGYPPPAMTQLLGTGVTDHRGLVELPALAVLFDDLGGMPFYFAEPETSSMQARLSMSMLHRPEVHDRLRATAELAISDPGYGSTTVQITRADGSVVCVGTARNVRVGRPVVDGSDDLALPEPVAPNSQPAVAPLDPALSGAEVVAQLIDGTLPVGPITELLGGSVTRSDDDGSVAVEFTAAPWMANLMGTMHGGVIAAMLAQACSFDAQRNVRAGGGYQLIDFTCEFHRSPVVDGRSVRVEVTPVKLGRRLSIFDARMYDGEQLLGRATADARFDV